MASDGKPQLMGIWMTTALVIGAMIGGAIFMLPVTLAPLGFNAVIGWVISGLGALCIVFGLAQISRFGGEGIQANIEREFGPTSGFLATWSFWVSNWVAQASVAIATASALSFIDPRFGGAGTVVSIAIGCVVLLTIVNAIGVRAAGGLSIVTVAIRVLPLLAVIWLFVERGASGAAYEPFAPVPISFANVATATALTFFALTGFEAATAPVCKIRDASRTIPRALLWGTAFVAVLYLVAGTSIQMLLPASVVAASPAPFADALVSHWGHGAASFAALAIAIAAFGCLNCLILGTGELGYSMALRGDLPSVMTRTRGANTPVASQIVGSAMTILLLLANGSRATANLYTFIILLSTAAVIVIYLAGVLAAWKASPTLGARAILVVALLFIAFAIYGTGLEADLWCLALLAAGLAIRAVIRRLNSRGDSSPATEANRAALPESSS
ncbi:MAG TPA: amino acid permease [Sphingomicrobium sp.]|nr:amino acid permease [Sphingomicrobium sp.]